MKNLYIVLISGLLCLAHSLAFTPVLMAQKKPLPVTSDQDRQSAHPRKSKPIIKPDWVGINEIIKSTPDSAILSGSAILCTGGSTFLSVSITGGIPPYTLSIDNGIGLIAGYNSGDAILVSPLITTTYNLLSVTDADGHPALLLGGAATVTVLSYPSFNPVIYPGAPFVCPATGTNIIISSQNDGYSYQLMQASDSSSVGAPFTGNGTLHSVLTGPLSATESYYIIISNGPCLYTATSSTTVWVIPDTIPPTLTCPPNINTTTSPGRCDAINVFLGIPMYFDNCGIASITNNAPMSYPLGTTTVIWYAYDNSGNFTTCNQTVTVIDNVPPVITCPPPITTTVDSGNCYVSGLNLGTPSTADNCAVISVTNNAPLVFPVGITNVIWTVTDSGGLSTTCTQVITILDTIPPVILCPPDLSVITDVSSCFATGVNLGVPDTSDNCQVASVTNDAPAAFPVGSTLVTWIATDLYGNTDTCTQTVTVADIIPPVISCPPLVNATTDPGGCTATAVDPGTPTATDNCAVDTVFCIAPASFPIGSTDVLWIAIDIYGNSDTCVQQIVVTDPVPPVISCPPDLNISTDLNSCFASGLNLGTPTSSDNCGTPIITNDAPLEFPVGITLVNWLVTDSSGNTDTCVQQVTVADLIPPVILCPPDLSVITDASSCFATGVNLGVPDTSDNCQVASVTNDAPAAFPVGSTLVTWITTDLYGNTDTCTQTVTVADSIPPVISCPPLVNTTTDPGGCTATAVDPGTPTATDNCVVDTVFSIAPASFPIGSTDVLWVAIDIYGNSDTCVQQVVVTDPEPPVISCPPDLNVSTDPNSCFASGLNLGTPTSSDNCGTPVITNDAPLQFPVGVTLVNWLVTDSSGNTSTCVQQVTVADLIPPVIQCPSDVISGTDPGSCSATGVALGTPVATDNCGIATITNNAPAVFPIGSTSILWIATDLYGNADSCTQNVSIADLEPPLILCPPNLTFPADSGTCNATGIDPGLPVTSDNCGVASVVNNALVLYPVGNTTVTWTVTDIYGNTSSCQQIITVTETIPPVITCPPDVYVNADPGSCNATGVSLGAPVTTDNCGIAGVTNDAPLAFPAGAPTTVTWIVSDLSGNTDTCTQLVFVNAVPLAVDDYTSTSPGDPVSGNVLLNDQGICDTVIAGIITNPTNGTVIFNPDGTFTYTPDSTFTGTDSFVYIICDSTGDCDTATVYIEVAEPVILHSNLGLAKSGDYAYQADGSFLATFTIMVENLGTDNLADVQVYENLSATLPLPATFNVVAPPNCTWPLNPNLSYDGKVQTAMLDAATSTLPAGSSATISVTAKVWLNAFGEQNFLNTATGSATGLFGIGYPVSDTSDAGNVTDADKDSIADEWGENDPLLFTLSLPGIAIPEGFSPDGDGINDLLVIPGLENYPLNRLDVYNRWGNKVYHQSPYRNDWDAVPNIREMTIGRDKVPPGTYYYILDLKAEGYKPLAGYLVIQY